jgi:hypothetical protein
LQGDAYRCHLRLDTSEGIDHRLYARVKMRSPEGDFKEFEKAEILNFRVRK